MPTLAELFDEAEAAGTLASLPDAAFPRLHQPTKDVALNMTFLAEQAAGKDPARAAAAVRLVGMLAATRLHDSVARPVVEAATLSKDEAVRTAALLAVDAVDVALVEKAAALAVEAPQ